LTVNPTQLRSADAQRDLFHDVKPVVRFGACMKRVLSIFLALSVLGPQILRAEDPDVAYLDVYTLLQQGDQLNADGKVPEALARYRQAQIALRNFQRSHPEWKPKTVEYRANYLAQKVQQLSATNAAAQSNASAKASSAAPVASKVSVKLISPGAEPRTALRLHPKEGDKQTASITIKSAMEMTLGGNKNPEMKLPTTVITTETTAKSVAPDGDINYETATKDVLVDDQSALPQLKGLSAAGTITSRGINKHIDVKVPGGLPPQARQLADQMKEEFSRPTMPLPEEPIGVGAKWEVKISQKSGGIAMEQTYTCELASLEGDKAVTRINYTQTAANQKIENPSMPGVKLDLTHFAGKGGGEAIVDLAKVIPTQTTTDGELEMVMATGSGAQKQEISVKMTINVGTDAK
jgi:hypothetical protein